MKRITKRFTSVPKVQRMPFKLEIWSCGGREVLRFRGIEKALREFNSFLRCIHISELFLINEKRGFLLRTFYRRLG